MRTRFVYASMLIVVLAVVGAAQSRPDLSGTWVPVDSVTGTPPPPPSTPGGPPPPPPPPRTLSIRITQSPTQLTFERRVELDGRETLETATYVPGGSETVRQTGVLTFRTRAAWDGDALVLSSVVSHEGGAIGELSETYRLTNGRLVAESTRKSPAGTFTGRTIHERKE